MIHSLDNSDVNAFPPESQRLSASTAQSTGQSTSRRDAVAPHRTVFANIANTVGRQRIQRPTAKTKPCVHARSAVPVGRRRRKPTSPQGKENREGMTWEFAVYNQTDKATFTT